IGPFHCSREADRKSPAAAGEYRRDPAEFSCPQPCGQPTGEGKPPHHAARGPLLEETTDTIHTCGLRVWNSKKCPQTRPFWTIAQEVFQPLFAVRGSAMLDGSPRNGVQGAARGSVEQSIELSTAPAWPEVAAR